MRILLVEDDRASAGFVTKSLEEHGHVVDTATDGRQGLFLATTATYGVLIVDRMLPILDGLGLVKALRATDVKTPVLFLTTKAGIGDRVEGLEAGGDDYLVKPFAFAELLARIGALARRPPLTQVDTVLRIADVEMDLIARKVWRAGREIDLQPREFLLLEYFLRNPGRLLTRTMLLESVWDFHFDPKTNIVETHVSRLRSKFERGFDRELIETVRGSGYRLRAPA